MSNTGFLLLLSCQNKAFVKKKKAIEKYMFTFGIEKMNTLEENILIHVSKYILFSHRIL